METRRRRAAVGLRGNDPVRGNAAGAGAGDGARVARVVTGSGLMRAAALGSTTLARTWELSVAEVLAARFGPAVAVGSPGVAPPGIAAMPSRGWAQQPYTRLDGSAGHRANRRVDVIAEGFDIAIRVHFPPLAPSDLVMRQLDQSTQCLVASPALVAQALMSPADLAGLPSLDLGPPHREHAWQLRHEDGRTAAVRHAPRLVTDDMPALRDAAYAGVGVVQLPMMMIWEDLAAGRLVEVLPGWHPPAGIVHATFASRRGLLPSVRAFLDFLVRECAAQRIQADRSLGRGDLATGDA